MLIRITLIIAILAGLATGVLNFVVVKDKVITLQKDRDTEKAAHKEFQDKYTVTKKDLDKTTKELASTKEILKSTTEEKDKAVAEAANQTKRADKLAEDLTKTRAERDDAQSQLAAYKVSGMSAEQVANAAKHIKILDDSLVGAQQENVLIAKKLTKTEAKLALYERPGDFVTLPADLKGKVLVTDPKWSFVILNVGDDQQMKDRAELLVNRNGKLVAKVIVTSISKDRCVANVMPGWQLGEVYEGDVVIPAHPES